MVTRVRPYRESKTSGGIWGGGGSFRTVARKLGSHPSSASKWLDDLGPKAPRLFGLQFNFLPR